MKIKIILLLLSCSFSSLWGCSHLFYHPSNEFFIKNPEVLNGFKEDVNFSSLDQTPLTGWYFKSQTKPKHVTVIQFHGNGQNMTSHFIALAWLTDFGYDFFAFDYRGYGTSKSDPSQEGLNQDSLAAIRYIMKRTPVKAGAEPDLILYGQSLGGAVVLRALGDLTAEERHRIKAVVIESSFHNYKSIAAEYLSRSWITWLFQPLAYVLISNAYSPEDYISKVSPIPLLVFHGDRDPIIPLRFGEKIFSLANPPKKMIVIPKGGHIDAMFIDRQKYRLDLLKFFDGAHGGTRTPTSYDTGS